MDNTDTWEVSGGLTSFRTVLHRFAMETTEDGACSPSQGRERALERFDLTGQWAEWLALASPHGGVFARSQFSALL